MEIFVLLIVALSAVHCSAYDDNCTVHVVLQGATGDLAKRYLWSAIFNNYVAQLQSGDSNCKFISVTASSREPASKGDDILAALDNTLKCPVTAGTPEQCSILKTRFSNLVWYHQLKYEEDYSLLAAKQQELDEDCTTCSVGKLFYLSVPPHAYSSIAKHIHVHLRPKGDSGWLRVLFEKPFGSDLNSAVSLHNDVGQYLQEDEIYRVDHYLGKSGVKQILSFRHHSKEQLQDYWHNDHISHIEVVIKEKVDCSGRTKFYDQYGIIRDVFQNHLTEMLTLVAMEILTGERDSNKMKFLTSLFPPRLYNAVLGQYDGYISHLVSDGLQQNAQNVSRTPTYASVILFSRAPQWAGVPFFLTSGKSLGKKSSYIRVVFKDTLISSQYFADSICNPEIIFIIQDDHFEVPGILVSKHFIDLISVENNEGWKRYTINTTDFECRPYIYLNANSDSLGNDAYTDLLQSALLGNKDKFVSTERLFALWKIWSPLLEEIETASPHIQLYGENTLELLCYKRIGSKLHYIQLSPGTEETLPMVNTLGKSTVTSGLLQSNVIVGNKFTLVDQLTLKLKHLVSQAANHGLPFHMALPGGTSPELFYQNLVMERNSFPWDIIHIWQVDERCVPYNSLHSNLHNIDSKFLQLVPITRSNVHPMIDNRGNCHDADITYQAELSQHNAIHDMVILGLGKDGHIASLFTNSNDSKVLVTHVKLQESHLVEIKERISMTFNAILQAKYVAVLAVDDSKCDIVMMLLNNDGAHLPAARLLHQPNVFWYIDQNCVQNI